MMHLVKKLAANQTIGCKIWAIPSLVVTFLSVASASAGEVVTLEASDFPNEAACTPAVLPSPRFDLVVDGLYGRLENNLAGLAQTQDPIQILTEAASFEYKRLTPFLNDGDPETHELHFSQFQYEARARADLSVTGRRSFDRLRALGLTRAELTNQVSRTLSEGDLWRWGGNVDPDFDPEKARRVASTVVNRAYDVAWALKGPVNIRREIRDGLGWVAVSGEDDRPHTPVNTENANYPQRDMSISVDGKNLILRTVFMNPNTIDWDPSIVIDTSRLPTPQPIPDISGNALIFLHGHASTAEEAVTLVPHIFEAARQYGKELTIVSLDLPGYGYSSTLDTSRFTNLPLDTFPNTYEGLELIETALDVMVQRLEREQPALNVIGVIGGSLGGNLGLRLAGKNLALYPWVQNVVAWSPASVWPSFADSCDERRYRGGSSCRTAGLEADVAQRKLAVNTTHRMVGEYHEGKRAHFYDGDRFRRGSQYSIAGRWFHESFVCKENYIEASKWSVGEYFSRGYVPWHWRIANEQLVFSHWDPPRNLLDSYQIYPKLLTIAAEGDQHKPEYLYSSAIDLSAEMTRNYGRTISLPNTGHSVHAERPSWLGRQIVDFVHEVPPEIISSVVNSILIH